MRRSRLFASAALAATLAISAPALAGPPENTTPNCFGKSASEIARGEFNTIVNMGTHASEQEEPRLGIKNTARALSFVHQSDLAHFLGDLVGEDICVSN